MALTRSAYPGGVPDSVPGPSARFTGGGARVAPAGSRTSDATSAGAPGGTPDRTTDRTTTDRTPHAHPAARGSVLVPLLGLGLLACVLGLLLTGAAAATALGDPGAVTRWGLPLFRVLSDLSAALTVGLLVLAATALPANGWTAASRDGHEPVLDGVTARAARLAGAAGAAWVVTGAAVVVLSYSRISGFALTDPRFTDGLAVYVSDLDALRSLLISVLAAAVVTTGAAVATRHTTLGLMAVVALAALLPVALTGHAAGSTSHEVAVDSLAAHLLGVSVWVGGLVALALLRPALGGRLPVVAARYSRLALIAFVLVAASGGVNAWLRLGGWSGL